MSADHTGGASGQPSPTSRPAKELGATLLKMIGAIAIIFPILWAAYTYYHQEIEQRRQDFLRAYDIVHGTLGKGITDSIDKAIKPIYDSSDDKLAKARALSG